EFQLVVTDTAFPAGLEDEGENERIDSKHHDRMHERPADAEHRAAIATEHLALHELVHEVAVAPCGGEARERRNSRAGMRVARSRGGGGRVQDRATFSAYHAYALRKPSSSGVLARQPRSCSRETSITLRGVPSGLEGSYANSPR